MATDEISLAMANLTTEGSTPEKAAKPKELLKKLCLENNLNPQFTYTKDKKNQSILCRLQIKGYDQVGVGKSKAKKRSKTEATKHFLEILASQKVIPALPKKIKKERKSGSKPSTKELKILDTNSVNGNRTVEAAEQILLEFIKSNNKNDYKMCSKVTGNNYEVEMSLFIDKLNKTISAREIGRSKISATEKCTNFLVSELYRLEQIKRLSDKKNKVKLHCVHNVVSVNEKLMNDIYRLLEELQIKPINIKDIDCKSLILNQVPESLEKSLEFSAGRVIPWSPPSASWNPWLNKKIINPKSLTQISNMIKNNVTEKSRYHLLKKRSTDRSKLPIFNKKDEILKLIESNSIVIVQGGTGCGKTTQVCQFILDKYIDMKKGAYCNVICTQPRRVSAISIANRVAFERAEALGKSVGYTVRFDRINPQSFGAVMFCTVEILIRILQNGLIGISHVIVDEVHERSADCEFLLIILKEMIQKFPELRVILMSANGNLKLFSEYFNNCPIIDVEGRCYPVKEYFLEDIVKMLNYKPSFDKKTLKKQKKIKGQVNCNLLVSKTYPNDVRQIVAKIDENEHHLKIIESLLVYIDNLKVDGAVLIFLPGWTWITELNNHLRNNEVVVNHCVILFLHSKLPQVEQHKVFMPVARGKRKVILSTNIAETSVTIDDVVFVIDCGKANEVEFSNNMKIIDTVWASKVNIEQRKGRAGRVQAGTCFYLYTKVKFVDDNFVVLKKDLKERFNRMEDNISSKLLNCSLNTYSLKIKLLRLGDIHTFFKKAVDPPPTETVNSAVILLTEIKCLDANGELTALGRILAQLPIEPQFGRMMILGNFFMLGDALSTIAAGFSTNYDLFMENDDGKTAKLHFSGNRCSDQLAFLNAFMECKALNNGFDTFYEYNLSTSALKTSNNIKNQLINKFMKFGFPKCCFEIQNFDFGRTRLFDEPQLDMLSALLTMAFYPNIYCHTGKTKVNPKINNFGKISRTSVNVSNKQSGPFQSPFFIFEQQNGVMCCNTTMVSPIHLLLFGACKVEYVNNSIIVLDDWICLEMDVEDATAIVSLRPVIDDLIFRISNNPNLILDHNENDIKLFNILMDLCDFNAGRHNLPFITFDKKYEV